MHYAAVLNQYPLFVTLQQLADARQIPTYVVGGFVRDMLLQRPCKDIDIVCVGSGIELAQAFCNKLPGATLKIFKNFGTAMVRWQDYEVEFVGARKESYQQHSRKPSIAAGTLADDQHRRDFTINALAIGLNKSAFGQLIDPFEGVADLNKKIIRTPLAPHLTFSDDPLRMLRAIRFASQLNFDLTPSTKKAIQQESKRIGIVSQERIVTELNKIIASSNPAKGFYLLDSTHLLGLILPEMVALKEGSTTQGKSHKDNFVHTLQVLTNVAKVSDNLWLRWAALLHDIAKPRTKRFDPVIGFTFHGHEEVGARMIPPIFRRMRLPLKDKMLYVQKLVRLHLRPIALVQAQVTDAAVRRLIYEAGDSLEDLMCLCRADITSKNDRKVQQYLANFDLVAQKIKQVQAKDQIRNLQPVIHGDIIMKTFQLPPCKKVGLLKESIKEAILQGIIPNEYEPAYAYMLQQGLAQGLTPIGPELGPRS